MLSHRNLLVNARQCIDAVEDMLRDDDHSILFLPLAHSLAKIVLLVGSERGLSAAIATDIGHLAEELPMVQPTLFTAVPARLREGPRTSARRRPTPRARARIFDARPMWPSAGRARTAAGRVGLPT